MKRAGLVALSTVCLLLGTAVPTQALGLLDQRSDEDSLQLHVRSPGALQARELAGNLTLDGASLDGDPRPVEAEQATWRGFENVTTLTMNGSGRLLIAHDGTGLILEVDGPAEGGNEPRTHGPARRDGGGPEAGETTNASTSEPATTNAEGRSGDPGPDEATSGSASSSPEGEEAEADPGFPLLRQPVATVLGLLAAGAFLVELFSRSASREP